MTKTIKLKLSEEEVQTLRSAANLLLDVADAFTGAVYPVELDGIDQELLYKLLNYYQAKATEVLNSDAYRATIEDNVTVE